MQTFGQKYGGKELLLECKPRQVIYRFLIRAAHRQIVFLLFGSFGISKVGVLVFVFQSLFSVESVYAPVQDRFLAVFEDSGKPLGQNRVIEHVFSWAQYVAVFQICVF